MWLTFTVVVVVLTAALAFGRKRSSSNLPPGGMGWPLIGHTMSFMKLHPTTTLGDFMDHHISRFGKIFTANLFGERTIVSADPEFTHFILQNEMKLFEQGWQGGLVKVVGETSILFAVGQAHKDLRSVVLGFLSSQRVRTQFLHDSEELASMILSSWKHKPVVYARNEARKFTFGIMAKNTISIALEDPECEKLRREFEVYSKGFSSLPLNLPGTTCWKSIQARNNLQKFIEQEMGGRMKKGGENAEREEEDDLLSWFMKNIKDKSSQNIGTQLLGLIFAGHDTTSRAISLLIYFLEGCPKAVDELREEHLRLIQSKKQGGDCTLTWDDYRSMEFTQCVVSETLRLGNVGVFFRKKASTDINFKGYDIPRGYNVMASLAAVHLDPSSFEEPEHFNPWRWMSSNGIKKSNSFMPFGGGARICPGQEVAKLEMTVFLHHLILNYNWELAEPELPVTCAFVEFPKGLPIKVQSVQC